MDLNVNYNRNDNRSGGIGFFGLLTIVFITLKLIGVINWTWFQVFSPIIFCVGLNVLVLVICLIIAFVAFLIEWFS